MKKREDKADKEDNFFLIYYEEKKQKREWELIQNHHAYNTLTTLCWELRKIFRNNQKENLGLLEEEEWTSCFSCWKGS